MTPKISIAVPMYNNSSYIEQTIKSIQEQSYPGPLEIIVVDDRSSDDSYDKVKKINDDRIRLYRNEKNLGPSGNWNRAVDLCQGTYIKLLCGDDLLEKSCLEEQVKVLDEPSNSDISLVCSWRYIINSKSKVLMTRGFLKGGGRFSKKQVISEMTKQGTNVLGEPASGLFRRESFKNVRYRLDSYTIDVDFWVQLLDQGNLYMLAKPLYRFRISNQSWSARIATDQLREFVVFLRRVLDNEKIFLSKLQRLKLRFAMTRQFVGRILLFKLMA